MVLWMQSFRELLRSALPFEWAEPDFMLNAFVVIVMLGPLCAALGVKVVNFRMAFFSDAISHSAFTGVVIGFVIVRLLWHTSPDIDYWDRIIPPITLIAFGLIVAAGITALKRRTELSTDTVIGVFFATVIAGGIALITRMGLTANFQRYLFGSILTASDADVLATALLSIATIIYLAIAFNGLMLVGLNNALAASRGICTRLHDFAFSALLALVVTLSIRTVGLLLVTALLIVPAAAARNLARSVGAMLRWAVALGFATGVCGLIAAYYLDTAAGAMIVLFAALAFACSLMVRGIRA